MSNLAANIGDIAGAVGKGLFAGLVGTVAMTVGQTIEMKLTGREASATPAEGVEKALPIKAPEEKEEKLKLAQLSHFAYGTCWGVPLALLHKTGLPVPAATLGQFGAVWGTAMIMLPKMNLAPPVREWDAKTLLTDGLHHAIYAAAAGATYYAISRDDR